MEISAYEIKIDPDFILRIVIIYMITIRLYQHLINKEIFFLKHGGT